MSEQRRTSVIVTGLVAATIVSVLFIATLSNSESVSDPAESTTADDKPEPELTSHDQVERPEIADTEDPEDPEDPGNSGRPGFPSFDVSAGQTDQLFLAPDYSTAGYRDAQAEAAQYLTGLTYQWSRNFIVEIDSTAVERLLSEFETDYSDLEGSFDVSPIPEVPCVISSLRDTNPPFVVRGADGKPTAYSFRAICDNSNLSAVATITSRERDNAFIVTLTSRHHGEFVVMKLGDSFFALVHRNDDRAR